MPRGRKAAAPSSRALISHGVQYPASCCVPSFSLNRCQYSTTLGLPLELLPAVEGHALRATIGIRIATRSLQLGRDEAPTGRGDMFADWPGRDS
jgi:hypothetical protein